MKDLIKIGFILFVGIFFSTIHFLQSAPITRAMLQVLARKNAGGATPSFDFIETFDASGYDNSSSWTENLLGDGILNEDYTSTILEGTQSLHLSCPSSDRADDTAVLASDISDCWAFFILRPVSLVAVGNAFFTFRNSSGTVIYSIEWQASDVIRMRCGTANQTTVGSLSAGTTYYCWCHYTKGTGANAFASFGFATTTTEPTSGNNYVSLTTGTPTTDVHDIQLGRIGNGTHELIWDRVIVNSSAIGDNP